ncbi:MAG: ATP-binding cassette domain-containing protein [Thermoprotei archaeon]
MPQENSVALEVKGLKVTFRTLTGFPFLNRKRLTVDALSDISFSVFEGDAFGVAGETGSGKSTLAKVLVGLYAPSSGEIRVFGEKVDYSKRESLRDLRRKVGLVMQDPFTSLNPRLKARDIIKEALIASPDTFSGSFDDRIDEVSEMVGLKHESLECYPRQLSGGEKQRVSIARALVVPKKIIVLDEPTSSLDVSVQAQVLNTLKDLKKQLNLTYVFITHDLSVLKFMSNRMGVLFYGKLMEMGPTRKIMESCLHPYTKELIRQSFDPEAGEQASEPIEHVPASSGCRYSKVCPHFFHMCTQDPPAFEVERDHVVSCFLCAKAV